MCKRLGKIGCMVYAGIMILLIGTGIFFPGVYEDVLPFRFYNVLTNSMEPKISTNSLVLVKAYKEGMDLEGKIITFRAKRFGEDVVITHRFSHTEKNEDGQVIYRTHPEESEVLDPYMTVQEDILGVYVSHIPFVGKWSMFLRSPFGLIWLGEIMAILLIKRTILAFWEEKEKAKHEKGAEVFSGC